MISIVMPLYNGIEFLKESINSIISQTLKDWELIIVANGLSTAKINDIIRIIASFQDKRIKCIRINKRGKIKALNKGVFYAKNNIIALIDVDDIWMPEKLEKQLPLLQKYDVVGGDVEYFDEHHGSPNLFLGQLIKSMFIWQNPLINSMVILKKENAWWDESWEGLDDYNLWFYLLNKGKTFYNVPEILGKHRIHKNSYFNKKNNKLHNDFKLKIGNLSEDEIKYLKSIIDNKEWL